MNTHSTTFAKATLEYDPAAQNRKTFQNHNVVRPEFGRAR